MYLLLFSYWDQFPVLCTSYWKKLLSVVYFYPLLSFKIINIRNITHSIIVHSRLPDIVRHLQLEAVRLPPVTEQLPEEQEEEHCPEAGQAAVQHVLPLHLPLVLQWGAHTLVGGSTVQNSGCCWTSCGCGCRACRYGG